MSRGVSALFLAMTLFSSIAVTTTDGRRSAATVAAGGKLLTIGLVADNHYDTFPAGEKAPWEPLPHWLKGQVQRTTTQTKRRYDIAKDKMDESIEIFNNIPEMTLVVNLGDLVNNDMMWNLKPILDRFNQARAPHYHLLGNHDLRGHNDRFGKLNTTQADWVKNKFGLTEWYYALDHPPFKFLFLDSMVLEPESNDLKKKKEHMDWIQQQLNDARDSKRVVILFAHIPIGFQTNVLAPILKTYDHIALAFFGHDHKGGYTIQGKTHCVTLNGQIETMMNAFAVVEVFADRAEMTGFGRVPTRVMSFTPETTLLLQSYDGPVSHDLTIQGNQPLAPKALWKGEVLQKPPPLLLNIPNYRKPQLPPTDPNPGETRFLKEVYRLWPKRARTPSPEDPVDLTNYLTETKKDKPNWLTPDTPQNSTGSEKKAREYVAIEDDSLSEEGVGEEHQAPRTMPSEGSDVPRRPTIPSLSTNESSSAFMFGYLLVVPVLITVGGAGFLLLRKKRRGKGASPT